MTDHHGQRRLTASSLPDGHPSPGGILHRQPVLARVSEPAEGDLRRGATSRRRRMWLGLGLQIGDHNLGL